jgi:Transposase DDE domain
VADSDDARIDLLSISDLLNRHATEALAKRVYAKVRRRERVRLWGLWELLSFWIWVALHAPPSLRSALSTLRGQHGLFSLPPSAPSALFARSKNLSWRFFDEFFKDFRASVAAEAPRTHASRLRDVIARFGAVQAVDGSRLDQVAHRLKVVWKETRAVLAGAVVALFDLATGTLAQLCYSPDAGASEFRAACRALKGVAEGALLVADRLYGSPAHFRALSRRGIFGVARRFGPVSIKSRSELSRARSGRRLVVDELVAAGAKAERLRLISLVERGETVLELFTNVLDPARLSAEEALLVYEHRWSVERVFDELKSLLDLHTFYAANVNAVGMQLFTAAVVHTAMRVARAKAAEQINVAPEEISPAKLFPLAANASAALAWSDCVFAEVVAVNPGVELKRPDLSRFAFASTTFKAVRVEPRRSKKRQQPRPRHETQPGQQTWTSIPRHRRRK